MVEKNLQEVTMMANDANTHGKGHRQYAASMIACSCGRTHFTEQATFRNCVAGAPDVPAYAILRRMAEIDAALIEQDQWIVYIICEERIYVEACPCRGWYIREHQQYNKCPTT